MADLQITGLNALAQSSIAVDDELAIADVSQTETKKVTVKDLVNAVVTASGTSFLADSAIPGAKIGTLGTNQVSTGSLGTGVVTNVKIETSTSATTGIDGGQKLRDGTVTVIKLDSTKFDRGLSVASAKLGITNSITAGTKSGITYTAQGLISSVADLTATDLPEATSSAVGAVKVESGSLLEVSGTGAIDIKNVSGLSAGTYASVTVNAKGQVTAGSTTASATNIPTATASAKGGVIVPTSGGMAVDVSGNLSIATQGSVSAGDYAKVTVNTKGIVTGTGTLAATDIPDHSAAKLTSGTIPAARIGSSAINSDRIDTSAVTNAKIETSSSATTGIDGSTKLRDGTVTVDKLDSSKFDRGLSVVSSKLGINNAVSGGASTRSGISYDAQGLILSTVALGASDLPKATTSAIGAVSVGSGLSVNGSGVLTLSNSVTGTQVSGITFNNNGQITAATGLVAGDLPTATTSAKGAVQITSGGGLTVDGSGNLITSTSGVSAGTYQSVTVNTKGVVTAGAALTASLIPVLDAGKITTGSLAAARIGTDTIDGSKLSNSSTTIFQSIAQAGYPTAQFTGQLLFDPIAEDAYLWDGNAWNPITTLTKGALQRFGTYNASTSKVDYVTAAGAAAGLTVGQNLPVASDSVDGGYVVISVQGTPSGIAGITGQLSPPDYLLGVTASASSSSWVEIDLSTTVASQQATAIAYTPYGQLSATNVQAVINELEDEKLSLAGGTVTGQVLIGQAGSLVFEGATADAFETTLQVQDPTTSDKVITLPNITGTVITNGDTNTVTSTMVDGSLVNANLAAGAAIAFSKLAALTSAQILVGNGSNVATAVAVTGDISINNAGLTAIGAGKIVNSMVSGSAAITGSKVTTGTTSAVGVLQLTDSTSSTSTTTSATPNAVKSAFDLATTANTTAGNAVAKSGSTMTGNLIIDNAKEIRFSEADSNGANYLALKAPSSVTSDITWILPATDSTGTQFLKSDGSGNLGWATDSTTDNTKLPLNGGTMAGAINMGANNITNAGTITGTFSGNITGDLTGTASEFTVTANDSTDETCYPLFSDGATGSQGAETDTGLTYNPSSGKLTATEFVGNIDAVDGDFDGTLEADAITVGGTALDTVIAGTTVTNSTNAAHVSVADNESTNENNLIPFIEDASATGNVGLESDGDFHYNPSTGKVTATIVSDSKGDLRTIVQTSKSSQHTIVVGDSGKHSINSSGGWIINTSTAFTAGMAITLINNSGSDQTITATGVTLYNTADASTGNRTLAQRGMATVLCTASNTYYISGAGLS